MALAAGAAWLAAEPLSWIATGIALFAALNLIPRLRLSLLPLWLRRPLPTLIICASVIWTMRDLLWGDIPLSRDHPIHFYKTWVLVNDLLPSWQLSGWSDRWYGGLPMNEGYPVFPYLWSAALHILSAGLVSLETSYALGQVALWTLLCLGAFRWARLLGGSKAGLAAGIFVLLDAGAHQGGGREGGWTYIFQFGVWPQALGVALALHASLAARSALLDARPRDRGLTALLVGATLLAHPLAAVPLLSLIAALWLAHQLGPNERNLEHRGLVFALTLGMLIAAFWYGHFIESALTGLFASSGSTWRDLDDISTAAMRGNLFLDGWAIPMVLGLLGAAWLSRRRRPDDLTLLFVLAGGLLIASPHFWGALYGSNQLGLLASVQLDRLVIHVKTLFFVLAGVGLARALESQKNEKRATDDRSRSESLRRQLALALLCLLAGPFLLWSLRQASPHLFAEVGQIPTLRSLGEEDDARELERWLRQQREQAGDGPFRVAIQHDRGRPRVLEELFLVAARAGVSVHHLSSTPADTFRWRSHSARSADLQALSVRWIISRRPLENPSFTARQQIGPWHIYELHNAESREVTPEAIGAVQVVASSREGLLLDLDEVGPHSSLVIHRSPHPHWVATQAGRPLPLTTERRRGGPTFLRLDDLREGRLLLTYERPWIHTLLALVSLVAFLYALALTLPSRRLPAFFAEMLRYPPPSRGRGRASVPLLLAALIAISLALCAPYILRGEGPHDLVERLSSASFSASPSPPCRRLGICRVQTLPPIAVLRPRAGVVRPCTRITAPTAGSYRLRFADENLTGRLFGAWYWNGGPRDEWDLRPQPLPRPGPRVTVRFHGQTKQLSTAPEGRWQDFQLDGRSDGDVPELELELESTAPWRIDAFFRLELRASVQSDSSGFSIESSSR